MVGNQPVYREDVRITPGSSDFPASFVGNLSSYNTETDYQALLPARERVQEIVAATGGPLTVEMKGARIRGRARCGFRFI